MVGIIKNRDLLKKQEYLTMKEATDVLGIHENTLYNIFRNGDIKPIKYMRKNYLNTKDVINYAEERFGKIAVSKWMNNNEY
jgi:predicted site-specific integrase-resolvase